MLRSLLEIGDPFADLFGLRRTMNALADSVLRLGIFNEPGAPAKHLYRKDSTYVIEYALPGLDKKDIHIEVESNCLTVSGKYSKEED